MGLDGPRTKITTTGVGQLEGGVGVEQRAEEHDHAPRPPRRFQIHRAKIEFGGANELQVSTLVQPAGPDADARQHLEDPVDLLDLRDAADDRTPPIEQAGAEQRHRRVLGRANRDAPGELGAAFNPQMLRPGAAHGNERGVERLSNSGYHFQAEVLVSGFDAVHGALAGAQHVGQLGLGEPPMLTGVADQAPDPVQVRIRHVTEQYVICEIFDQAFACRTACRSQLHA
jgi:hypothetical protein